jgi:guanosine-3',5'-bis(diphosphate) 3'-pyrophosphohydrolase
MEKTLEIVLALAEQAHEGQFRRDGKTPYIKHPLAVAQILKDYNFTKNTLLAAAFLHDVVEDTEYTEDSLKETLLELLEEEFPSTYIGFVTETMFYVSSMTNKYDRAYYPEWNRKKRKQKEIEIFQSWTDEKLKALKIADITSNLRGFTSLDLDFAKVYIMEELEILRALRIEHKIWQDAVEECGEQFKNLIKRI